MNSQQQCIIKSHGIGEIILMNGKALATKQIISHSTN